MSNQFRPLPDRHGPVAGFFPTVLAALLLPLTASAADQANATAKSADSDGSPQSSSQPPTQKPDSLLRWSVSIEGIGLGRIGSVNRTLVGRVPGTVPFIATAVAPGTEAFNSNQFHQGFSAGPKIGIIYHDDSGFGAELSYFNIFNQSATQSIGPDSPADWLVMKAPGSFWQTQDFPDQAMAWTATTSLYSAEANGRWDLSRRVTLLAGFRWLQLNDNLLGTLGPADLTAPTWKSNPLTNLFQITPGTTAAGHYPPFWNTSTTNNLYGLQMGVAGKLLEFRRLSLVGLMKLGIFDNNATQSTGVSLEKVVYRSSATINHLAFVSEVGLQLNYQVVNNLTLRAGYEALWLEGIALAPGQIRETLTSGPSDVRALGVRSGSGLLFHGATTGLEYSF